MGQRLSCKIASAETVYAWPSKMTYDEETQLGVQDYSLENITRDAEDSAIFLPHQMDTAAWRAKYL